MTGKRKRRQVSRPLRHAKLYKALKLPKHWIAILKEYPDPLAVLPILLQSLSVTVAEDTCAAIEELTDVLLAKIGEESETEELVTVQ